MLTFDKGVAVSCSRAKEFDYYIYVKIVQRQTPNPGMTLDPGFKFSTGWLKRFMDTYKLKLRVGRGQLGEATSSQEVVSSQEALTTPDKDPNMRERLTKMLKHYCKEYNKYYTTLDSKEKSAVDRLEQTILLNLDIISDIVSCGPDNKLSSISIFLQGVDGRSRWLFLHGVRGVFIFFGVKKLH